MMKPTDQNEEFVTCEQTYENNLFVIMLSILCYEEPHSVLKTWVI